MSWRWQRVWSWRGWCFMLTYGQCFAVGFHTGFSWTAIRMNGFSFLLGPVTFDVQPPFPKWAKGPIIGDPQNPPDVP